MEYQAQFANQKSFHSDYVLVSVAFWNKRSKNFDKRSHRHLTFPSSPFTVHFPGDLHQPVSSLCLLHPLLSE